MTVSRLGSKSPKANLNSNLLHASCEKVYDYVKREDGTVFKGAFVKDLAARGILPDDPRVQQLMERIHRFDGPIDKESFIACVADNISILEKVYAGEMVIPDWEDFSSDLEEIYKSSKKNNGGKLADYIPGLAKQNPAHYGVAVCTIDGQRKKIGDTGVEFCIQSCSKPITYALALEEHGKEEVHSHVGREPSGEEFNALKLNKAGRPHNPLINSGAIMTCSLVGPKGMDAADRFDYVTKQWARLAGGKQMGYSNSVYLSERATADRNFALAYFMNENGAFPEGTDLVQILEFYFQCCSLTANADALSIVAATLANGGICPTTGEEVLDAETVKNCLSMMYSCGMYDYSGEFAFKIGLPAKSGVAGGVFVVIPNVMGICTFSPPLDKYGNSVRGVEFFAQLTDRFNFHNFDSLTHQSERRDPRKRKEEAEMVTVEEMIKYCSLGDLSALKRMTLKNVDFNLGDYDHRTPLHLAASNGHMNVVKYLVQHGDLEEINPIDRWGGTPFDDAVNEGWDEVANYLASMGAAAGPQKRRSMIVKEGA